MEALSYRPRNAGHDYYGRGTYLITLVVSGREALLSDFATKIDNKVSLALTPLGEAVQEAWLQTPDQQSKHGNKIAVHACVCMPDHFHGVIEVLEPMQWSLGDIIQAFKARCTSRWQQEQGLPTSVNRPISDVCFTEGAPAWLREKAAAYSNEGALVRAMSKKQRQTEVCSSWHLGISTQWVMSAMYHPTVTTVAFTTSTPSLLRYALFMEKQK